MNLKTLKTFDASYFRGRNYFAGDDGTQNYLVFQPIYKYFKKVIGVGNGNYIKFWKSKWFSEEKISSITGSNYAITPRLS